jgi:enolase
MPYSKALEMGAQLYAQLKKYLTKKHLLTSVGDEGGFTPQFSSNIEVLDVLKAVITESGFEYGKDAHLGLDCAASVYCDNGLYKVEAAVLPMDKPRYLSYLTDLVTNYALYFIEDPLQQDDWEGWIELTKQLSATCRIVGDDFLVTNPKRLSQAIEKEACNAVVVKVNQVGTITETLEVISIAKKAGYTVIVSHRSGETTDDFIADLAVGTNAQFVKFGAPARGERVAKYNRLLKIYSEITQ